MEKKLKIIFVWHWLKRSAESEDGVFAVFDSLIYAISQLSLKYDVELLALSDSRHGYYFSEGLSIKYYFATDLENIINHLVKNKPDIVFLNHHSRNYKKFLRQINTLSAVKIMYYSSPIYLNLIDFIKYWKVNGIFTKPINTEHRKIDYHIVHHNFQKEIIINKLKIKHDRVLVSPKTANPKIFRPAKLNKKWDCVYPGRSRERYWKRPELAIEACRLAKKTLVMPGSNLKNRYENVTVFKEWLNENELCAVYNQSRCMLITSNYLELGPRVIPEAAACNLPIVACADSPAAVSHIKKIGGFIAKPNINDLADKINLATSTICNSRNQLNQINYPFDLILKTISNLINKIER